MPIVRDIAIIIIAIEMFVFALVPIILLGALVYGAGWLRRHENLPSWLKLAPLAHRITSRSPSLISESQPSIEEPLTVTTKHLSGSWSP